MRKVVFTIDDLEYFKEKFNISDEAFKRIFEDEESFRAIYTLLGDDRNPNQYELTDFEGNTIFLDSLNGYEKGVILNDCYTYFTGGKCRTNDGKPHGVIKIDEILIKRNLYNIKEKRMN